MWGVTERAQYCNTLLKPTEIWRVIFNQSYGCIISSAGGHSLPSLRNSRRHKVVNMPVVLRAKCIIVGDAAVGKSSICQVFHSDSSHYPKTYTMTCGVEPLVKTVNIPDTKDTVEIYLNDSAGKEIFADLVQKFWDHPSMVVVVYDVTSETSFSSCHKWLERVRCQKPEFQPVGVLLANKTDLSQRRIVSPKSGKELADSLGLEYFECSAKEMDNVDSPFYYLANEYYKQYQDTVGQMQSLG